MDFKVPIIFKAEVALNSTKINLSPALVCSKLHLLVTTFFFSC